eukprot:SAG11_NODE_32_length_22830_cov_17.507941_20_plen_176_part_00
MEPEVGADGDWASSNNSWAIVAFNRAATVKSIMKSQAKNGMQHKVFSFCSLPVDLPCMPSLCVCWRAGGFVQQFNVVGGCELVFKPLDYSKHVESNVALSNLAADAEVELISLTSSGVQNAVTDAESAVSRIPYMSYLPVSAFYIFRTDPQVRESVLDIVFAMLGLFYFPLAFTW